jgi:hypothetical protein
MLYTKEEFEQKLKVKFDSMTQEDFNNLCVNTFNNLKIEENNFIKEILKSVWKIKSISFKQWKALNSFNNSISKNQNRKTF